MSIKHNYENSMSKKIKVYIFKNCEKNLQKNSFTSFFFGEKNIFATFQRIILPKNISIVKICQKTKKKKLMLGYVHSTNLLIIGWPI